MIIGIRIDQVVDIFRANTASKTCPSTDQKIHSVDRVTKLGHQAI